MKETSSNKNASNKISTTQLVYAALFTAILAICSWISIPSAVPFTMQTFAVFITLSLLGGKLGSLVIFVYILLGDIGVPVFSGFKGGPGALFGTTGGYILGFILTALVYWMITALCGNKLYIRITALLLGLTLCYAFGTIWFMYLYAAVNGPVSVMTALGWCVFPYLIPDFIKLALALFLRGRLYRYIHLS
ncbi:MAG: biotin transporter BioY [Lachnospiraceae bacterium]|nr:biotin transporter BioY [Lachnospiraceae bacterium]